MGSCCSKSSEVADSTSIVPSDNAKKSKSSPPKGNLILVGARPDPPAEAPVAAQPAEETKAATAATPEVNEVQVIEASPVAEKEKPADSTQVASSASADSASPASNPPATVNNSSVLSPNSRKQLRASGSQMFANDVLQGKLNAEAAQAGSAAGSRRVSRPSTPISRTGQAAQPTSANQLAVNPNAALGWPVAPNSPVFSEANTLASSGPQSNRATRRRSAETLKDVIPETIVEKIRAKKEAAPAQASTPTNALVSTGPQPSSRRSSGTFERVVTINKINPLPSKKGDEEEEEEEDAASTASKKNATGANGSANGEHREGFKLGTRFSEPNARYELTSTQESELRAKPYLWTDPHVYRYHINACFTYYSTLPVRTASPLPSPTSASSNSSSSTSSLPSIHQNDRIVWSQLQQLAKDSIQRLYLLIKRDLKRNSTITDEKELDKKIWNKLEDLLPGHGNESQTTQCIALAFLDHMAKSVPLTISRREFVQSFQEIHLALFCAPEDTNMKERKKLVQNIYKLKLEELSQPFPAGAAPSSEEQSSPASQVHSLFPSPIVNASRRSSGRMLEELAMKNNLERRNSVKLNELAPSPTNAALNANSQSFGDVSRRGSFNAGSIDRLVSFFGDTSKDKEAISRRASRNLGESRDSGAGINNSNVIDVTPVTIIQTNGTSRRGSYQNMRRTRSRSRSPENKY